MASAAEAALRPLRSGLMPVPAGAQAGICSTCRSGCEGEEEHCWPCREAAKAVGTMDVLPIAMSVEQGLLHRHLRGYKDDRSAPVRARMALRLAGLLAVFMGSHERCVGEFDSVVTVPSGRGVAMAPVIGLYGSLAAVHEPALAVSGLGTKRTPAAERFVVTQEVGGEKVLLLDDTFVSGASLFSAATALRRAGALVAGPVVIGRHVNPDYPTSEPMLRWLRGRQWDDGRCGRCAGERADEASML